MFHCDYVQKKKRKTQLSSSAAVAAASTSNLQPEEKLKSLNPSGE
jgi:hypothetical protein